MKRSHVIIASIAIFLIFTLLYNFASSEGSYESTIEDWRSDQEYFFKTSGKSPFKGTTFPVKLKYYPIDSKYRVACKVELFKENKLISLQTTGNQPRTYRKYGVLTFLLNGKSHALTVFQNEENASDLLLPFTDETTGTETYGAGRYIDLKQKPVEGTDFMLDFNLAKNPFCAYNHNYSCTLPPKENTLSISVEAGEKTY